MTHANLIEKIAEGVTAVRRIAKELPPQSELRKIFNYDAEAGQLLWRERPLGDFVNQGEQRRWNVRHAGSVAGSVNHRGYRIICINSIRYVAHRLVWTYHNGAIPTGISIDHVDGNGTNNKLPNLRLVTQAQNLRNCGHSARNKSGVKGVCWHKHTQKWKVSVWLNRKRHHLGYFDGIDDAASVAAKFYRENGFSERHIAQAEKDAVANQEDQRLGPE